MESKEIGLGTLYGVNKAVLKNEKSLKKYEIKEGINEIVEFIKNNRDKYYTLLCREKYDFTVFNFWDNVDKRSDKNYSTFRKELTDCLLNRGEVLSIEKHNADSAFEIWLKIDEEPYCYYFFCYDLGVIEII
jgi:hypothetical protein